MDDLDPERNSAQYNRGGIHRFISSDEGRFTFCESYEGNLVCTKNPRRHPIGTV